MDSRPGVTESGTADSRTVSIYAAVIRDVIEFRNRPVFVWTQLCEDADAAAAHYGPCPEALTPLEQEAIVALLASDVPNLSFVAETETVDQDIFDNIGAEVVRLGPIEELRKVVERDERDVRIQVPAMHICGGKCGGGSVWVVKQNNDGWEVTVRRLATTCGLPDRGETSRTKESR